jgi:putative transcriptional regulator
MKHLIGNLLISPPSIDHGFFQKSVILLTEDHSGGNVGVVLNKTSKVSLNEFAKHNNVILDVPGYAHIGGPVNPKALTMIHTNDWACSNTMRINDLFSISSSPDIFNYLANGYCPEHWRIFVGLCKWTPGQLSKEVNGLPPYEHKSSWLTATADLDIVFETDADDQWSESIERSGSEFAQNLFE